MRENLYLAKDGNVYLNYINLHKRNILQLRSYLTKESLAKLRMEYNRLEREINYLKIDNIIDDLSVNSNTNAKKKITEIRLQMQELNVIMNSSKNTKSECIFYTENDFDKLKELHPAVKFINVNSI